MASRPARVNHQFDPDAPHPELDDISLDGSGDNYWSSNADPFGIFSANGVVPPEMLSPAAVRKEARTRSKRVLDNFRKLRMIVDRHESALRKRWTKKGRPQRLAILLEAWPGMPLTHRPDFALFRRREKPKQAAPDERLAYMMPYINQEDLAKPKILPMLLSARARDHPSAFAAADGEAMHLGQVLMSIVPVFLNEYTMIMNGVKNDADYGKLLSWDDHEDAFDWMNMRTQFLPGEGLLVLEAQDRLMEFLIACCLKLLHDIPEEKLASYPIEATTEASDSPEEDSGLTYLAIMAEEAPYRHPAQLDLARIESLLAAKIASAKDHFWAMREDPSYFADEILEHSEHRQERIIDVQRNIHPSLKPGREHLFWARLSGHMVLGATRDLEMYTELHSQAQHLRSLQQRHHADIHQDKPLPEEYLYALLKFRYYTDQLLKGPMHRLKVAFPPSPPMRPHFTRAVPESESSSKMFVRTKPGDRLDDTEGQVLWLLRTLWEDEKELFLCGLPLIVDEVDRLLSAEPKAKELVSPLVVRILSDISILAECQKQVNMYQPWANGFEYAQVDRKTRLEQEYVKRFQMESGLVKAMYEYERQSAVALAVPTGKKFDYPANKRRNAENVRQLRLAESNLDAFWAHMDGIIHAKTDGFKGLVLERLLAQPRALQRTPEWVEVPKPAQKKSGESKADGVSEPDWLYMPFSSLNIASSGRKEALDSSVTSKPKLKTKGAPSEDDPTPPPQAEAAQPVQPAQDSFAVDTRALKVFRILFFNPDAGTTAGEVAWKDFLHALVSTGFGAQKLYGSVWHFEPRTLNVERSIQFHEPHPKGKLSFWIARHYGRRLSRAYGWSGGMFVSKV